MAVWPRLHGCLPKPVCTPVTSLRLLACKHDASWLLLLLTGALLLVACCLLLVDVISYLWQALEMGIIDKIVDVDAADHEGMIAAALDYALSASVQTTPLDRRRVSGMAVPGDTSDALFSDIRRYVATAARGMTAPAAIVAAVEASVHSATFDEGMAEEQRLFNELATGTQAPAMQHMFFADRACTRIPGVPKGSAAGIKTVGVVGAGTMGVGITMNFINKGIPVTLGGLTAAAVTARRH